MDARFLFYISLFTGVAALALLIQMLMLIGLYLSFRSTQRRFLALADRLEPILDTTRHLVDDTRHHTRNMFAKFNEIAEATRVQVMRVDDLLVEVTAHTRANLERIDRVATNAADRVEETIAMVQRTILAPVRGINGAAAAVRAVVGHLAGRRSSGGRVTQEEDLFI